MSVFTNVYLYLTNFNLALRIKIPSLELNFAYNLELAQKLGLI